MSKVSSFFSGVSRASDKLPAVMQQRLAMQRQGQQDRQKKAMAAFELAKATNDPAAIEVAFADLVASGAIPSTPGSDSAPPQANIASRLMGRLRGTPEVASPATSTMTADPRLVSIVQSAFQAQDDAKKERELRDLQIRQEQVRLKGQWNEQGPYVWRVSPETGNIEWKTKPPSLASGEIVSFTVESGMMRLKGLLNPVPMTDELRSYLKDNPDLPGVMSIDWDSGMWQDKNGEVHYLPDEQMQRIKEAEQRQQQDRVNLLERRYELSKELATMQSRARVGEKARERHSDLMGKYADLVRDGGDTPDRAAEAMRMQLQNFIEDPEALDALMDDSVTILAQYDARVKFTGDQQQELGEIASIQRQSDDILSMLDNPAIQDALKQHLGPITGRLDQFKAEWLGERGVPPEVRVFAAKMANLVDIVRRARTGAAIARSEESFYNTLMGSQVSDYRAIQDRLGALIDITQGMRESTWEQALEAYYLPDDVPDEAYQKIPKARRRRPAADPNLPTGLDLEGVQ